MKRSIWLMFFLAQLLVHPAYAGKLDKTRDAVDSDRSQKKSSSSSSSNDDHDDDDYDDDDDSSSAEAIGAIFDLLFLGLEVAADVAEQKALDDAYAAEQEAMAQERTYVEEDTSEEQSAESVEPPPSPKRWRTPDEKYDVATVLEPSGGSRDKGKLRLMLEYSPDIDGVHRIGFSGKILPESLFGLDLRTTQYLEQDCCGVDYLTIGDVNAVMHFPFGGYGLFQVGGGFNWMYDVPNAYFGINLTAGYQLRPVDPLVLSVDLDVGSLGEAAIIRGHAAIGARFWMMEVNGGYQATVLSGPGQTVGFHGPKVGVGLLL